MAKASLTLRTPESIELGYEIVSDHSQLIERVKFASESVTNGKILPGNIMEAVQEYRNLEIDSYVGGGLIDQLISRNPRAVGNMIADLHRGGIETIEIGNPNEDHLNLLKREFRTVIAEIGSKDDNDEYSKNVAAWERSLMTAIDAGAKEIVIEGGTGTVGIYKEGGEVKLWLLMRLIEIMAEKEYSGRKVLETSNPHHVMMMCGLFGTNIRLWNIETNSFYSPSPDKATFPQIIEWIDSTSEPQVNQCMEIFRRIVRTGEQKDLDLNEFMLNMVYRLETLEDHRNIGQRIEATLENVDALEHGADISSVYEH